MTRREEIEKLLLEKDRSLKELADYFRTEIKELLEDLDHVKNSVKLPHKFKTIPAFCNYCGFVYKEREKLKTPSKCPKCKKEDITEPRFKIV